MSNGNGLERKLRRVDQTQFRQMALPSNVSSFSNAVKLGHIGGAQQAFERISARSDKAVPANNIATMLQALSEKTDDSTLLSIHNRVYSLAKQEYTKLLTKYHLADEDENSPKLSPEQKEILRKDMGEILTGLLRYVDALPKESQDYRTEDKIAYVKQIILGYCRRFPEMTKVPENPSSEQLYVCIEDVMVRAVGKDIMMEIEKKSQKIKRAGAFDDDSSDEVKVDKYDTVFLHSHDTALEILKCRNWIANLDNIITLLCEDRRRSKGQEHFEEKKPKYLASLNEARGILTDKSAPEHEYGILAAIEEPVKERIAIAHYILQYFDSNPVDQMIILSQIQNALLSFAVNEKATLDIMVDEQRIPVKIATYNNTSAREFFEKQYQSGM